jgi:transcriptional regulator GlxA family with amidase domain
VARTIGILIFDDAEELDFVGPWEVFTALRQLQEHHGEEPVSVVTVSERGGEVRCAKGLRVIADHSFTDAPPLDVVLVPGGQGTRREVGNPTLVSWLQAAAEGSEWVTSVCTGALLLHEAGPAKGKRVTTHWSFVDSLRARGDVEVVEGERYVRDGNVVTSAGVSAGIDMALWLVGEWHGPDTARTVQHYIEYYPEPPYSENR